jgi:hypothetical protein
MIENHHTEAVQSKSNLSKYPNTHNPTFSSPEPSIAKVKAKGLYDNTEQVFTCSHDCQLRKRTKEGEKKKMI